MSKNKLTTSKSEAKLSEIKPKEILDVKFDKSDAVYLTGGVVSGDVIIKNKNPIEITSLVATLVMTIVHRTEDETDTHDFQIADLYSELNGNFKDRSKVLPAGPNNIHFTFSPLPILYFHTHKSDSKTRSYFIRVEMNTKNQKNIVKNKEFTVKNIFMNSFTEAQEWQSKKDKKFVPLNFKTSFLLATVPTGFDRREKKIPIHLLIHTPNSKVSKTIIRTRLLRIVRCPMNKKSKGVELLEHECVEHDYIYHKAKTILLETSKDTGALTISCPLISQTYKIEVEVLTSNCTLKVDFPLIIGRWKNGVADRDDPTYYIRKSLGTELGTCETPKSKLPKPPIDTQNPSTSATPPLENTIVSEMRATSDYVGSKSNELSFKVGQVFKDVYITGKRGWLVATMNGKTGMIPEDHVEPFYKH